MSEAFKFLEHTSDAFIESQGQTLEEAFQNAALAMFEVMTDTKTVDAKTEERVQTQAEDEYALLYEWLQLLLVKLEVEDKLYSEFRINTIEKISEGYALQATIKGEKYDPKRHPTRTGVKGVTYHEMNITRQEDKVTVRFLLDI